jgi:predicted Zn-dependent protease
MADLFDNRLLEQGQPAGAAFESEELRGPAPLPLRRFRYPPLMVAVAVAALIAACYSAAVQVPRLVAVTNELHEGQAALVQGRFDVARTKLAAAHAHSPTSRKVLIAYAEALFASGDDSDGLALLAHKALSQDEWNALSGYMPADVQALFAPTSGG